MGTKRVIAFLGAAALVVGAPVFSSAALAQESPLHSRIYLGLNGGFWGDDWQGAIALVATADDPNTVIAPDITMSLITDTDGNFHVETPAAIEPGWFITVTDGEIINTHTVRNISITSVDPATDVIRGTADPGTIVDHVGPSWLDATGMTTVADSTGAWTVDLTGEYDVTMADNVITSTSGLVANQIDESGCFNPSSQDCDGDFTYIDWAGPTSLDALLDDMVADGRLPNERVANTIVLLAERAPLRALTVYLRVLVLVRRITPATMGNILEMVAWTASIQ